MNSLSHRLRTAADIIDRFGEQPYMHVYADASDGVSITVNCFEPDEFPGLIRTLGGGEKRINDTTGYLQVARTFEDGLTGKVQLLSQVCELVEVGTETVEVEQVVEPAKVETVTVERPIFERRCPDSLLNLANQGNAYAHAGDAA